MSFSALRVTAAMHKRTDKDQQQGHSGSKWHTKGDAVHTLRLLEEAVDLPHLSHGCLRPPFCGYDGLDLVSQRLYVLRLGGKMEQRV